METPQGQFTDQDMTSRLNIGGSLPKLLLYGLSQPVGEAIGMFLVWVAIKVMYRFVDRFVILLIVLSPS